MSEHIGPQARGSQVGELGVKAGVWRHKLQFPHSNLVHKLTPSAFHQTSTLRHSPHLLHSFVRLWLRAARVLEQYYNKISVEVKHFLEHTRDVLPADGAENLVANGSVTCTLGFHTTI